MLLCPPVAGAMAIAMAVATVATATALRLPWPREMRAAAAAELLPQEARPLKHRTVRGHKLCPQEASRMQQRTAAVTLEPNHWYCCDVIMPSQRRTPLPNSRNIIAEIKVREQQSSCALLLTATLNAHCQYCCSVIIIQRSDPLVNSKKLTPRWKQAPQLRRPLSCKDL